jgi:NTP pyrophosphatase (non-canonical NTP hydrolase)
MKSKIEIEENVINWAKERNLIKKENRFVQLAKVIEELGELSKAMIEGNTSEIIDALGDTNITLIILAKQMDLLLSDCVGIAYNEIKERKGVTISGTFIKIS